MPIDTSTYTHNENGSHSITRARTNTPNKTTKANNSISSSSGSNGKKQAAKRNNTLWIFGVAQHSLTTYFMSMVFFSLSIVELLYRLTARFLFLSFRSFFSHAIFDISTFERILCSNINGVRAGIVNRPKNRVYFPPFGKPLISRIYFMNRIIFALSQFQLRCFPCVPWNWCIVVGKKPKVPLTGAISKQIS